MQSATPEYVGPLTAVARLRRGPGGWPGRGAVGFGRMTTFDLIVRNGSVVDGTGAPSVRADIGVLGDRVSAIGDLHGESASVEVDASRPLRHARLRRHPHPPRRAARVGPDRHVVVLARRHVGRARQLRRHVRARAGPSDREYLAEMMESVEDIPRRLASSTGCRGTGTTYGEYLDARRPHAEGRQRRRHGRPLRGAPPRDGRAQPRRGARRPTTTSRAMCELVDEAMRRRRARLLDVAHVAAPRARRPAGARHLGRRPTSCSRSATCSAGTGAACSRPRPALGERDDDALERHARRGALDGRASAAAPAAR